MIISFKSIVEPQLIKITDLNYFDHTHREDEPYIIIICNQLLICLLYIIIPEDLLDSVCHTIRLEQRLDEPLVRPMRTHTVKILQEHNASHSQATKMMIEESESNAFWTIFLYAEVNPADGNNIYCLLTNLIYKTVENRNNKFKFDFSWFLSILQFRIQIIHKLIFPTKFFCFFLPFFPIHTIHRDYLQNFPVSSIWITNIHFLKIIWIFLSFLFNCCSWYYLKAIRDELCKEEYRAIQFEGVPIFRHDQSWCSWFWLWKGTFFSTILNLFA